MVKQLAINHFSVIVVVVVVVVVGNNVIIVIIMISNYILGMATERLSCVWMKIYF